MATPTSNDEIEIEGEEVEAQMSVSGGPFGAFHEPIHESLTLSALINSNSAVARGITVKNASNHDWEYIRGAIWNDDPAGELFNDSANENHSYSTGYNWVKAYRRGESQWNPNDLESDRFRNAIGRSHFGDLQFLHCMANNLGEEPGKVKARVMLWMEVMYKLANGEDGITPETAVENTKLVEFFPVLSLPPSYKPLSFLLANESMIDSKFQGLDIQRRALGSMFHVIQDSYAIGHTKRTLLNPEDMQSSSPLKFRQGTVDRWGAIENFHTYSGQDGMAHSHYDHATDGIPNPGDLSDLDQWNNLIGCRDATDKCKGLADLKHAGKKWDEGVRDYLDQEVFAVSPNATVANNRVSG
ncbi:hypothetical protein CGCTS75_v010342 [Colletotrichum tropicale]|nr:hypothetical protein CGCTS75_v010342 [Colletotrichum tropicale]